MGYYGLLGAMDWIIAKISKAAECAPQNLAARGVVVVAFCGAESSKMTREKRMSNNR